MVEFNPFNSNLYYQLEVFLKLNTNLSGSFKFKQDQSIYTLTALDIKVFTEYKDYEKSRNSITLESSGQFIAAIPIIGSIASFILSIGYYIVRTKAAKSYDRTLAQILPSHHVKRQKITEIYSKYFVSLYLNNNSINETWVENEIAKALLDKEVSANNLTTDEISQLARIVLGTEYDVSSIKNSKNFIYKTIDCKMSEAFRQAGDVTWKTNMLARSLIGLLPFVKPVVSLVQWFNCFHQVMLNKPSLLCT